MADFPVRAPRTRKVRNKHLTVSHLLTGVATTWTPPIKGDVEFVAENADGNLSIDSEDRTVSVLVAEGIADGDDQDITLVAQSPDGSPKAKINVRLTGKIIEASAPAQPTISLIPGDGEVEVLVTNGADNGALITHHRIYSGSADDELVAGAPVVASTSHIIAATNGQAIFVAVAAINAIDEGPLSDIKSTTPVAVEEPDIDVPEAAINSLAQTISLISTPEGGVTYTVWTLANTLVGTLNSGNSYTLSIASTAAMPVRVRATDGSQTVWSTFFLMDQPSLFKLIDFANVSNNNDFTETVINGATPITRNPSNSETLGGAKVADGVLKLFKKTPTFSYAMAADAGHPERALMAFWGRIGIQSSTDGNANYRNININVGGANGTYLNLRLQQGQWTLTVRKTGGGGVTSTGSWTSVLTDGDFIGLMPVWSEDGTALYYQLYVEENGQLKPQVAGRGFLIPPADAANMTGTGLTLGNDLNNASCTTAMTNALATGWRWWYAVGARGMTGSAYSLNTATFAAPDMNNPPRINWRAWYQGTRSQTCAALVDLHSGAMLGDFQTFTNIGAGDTGTHTLSFDPVKAGGRNLALATYDPADAAGTFSVMTIGYAPYYPVMPLRSAQILGSQTSKQGDADYWNDRWWMSHSFVYTDNAGNTIAGYPVDFSGVISEEAWAAGARRIQFYILNGKIISDVDAGDWECTLNFDSSYTDSVFIGATSNVSPPVWNPATRKITWTATGGVSNSIQVNIRFTTRPATPLPDEERFYFSIGKVGRDPDQLCSTAWLADYGGVGAVRLTNLCNAANSGPQTFRDTFPFTNWYGSVVAEPYRISQLGAELNSIMNFVQLPGQTNERMIEFCMEWARRVKAYETNPATDPTKISSLPYMWSNGCEPWNPVVPYGDAMKQTIILAGQAGFFGFAPEGCNIILDHDNDYYVSGFSGLSNAKLVHDMPAGTVVFSYVWNDAALPAGRKEWCVIQALADAPAGTTTPNPAAVGNLNTEGTIIVRGIWETIQNATYTWRAWMLGLQADALRYGIAPSVGKGLVPSMAHLTDESVGLGRDRVLMYYDTYQGHTADQVANWLLAGGAGTEYVRKLWPGGVGGSGYTAHLATTTAAPSASSWQGKVTASDYAGAWPLYKNYLNTLVSGPLSLMRNQYFGFYSKARAAGIPADRMLEMYVYEQGNHISVRCDGGLPQALKFNAFYEYINGLAEYQEWLENFYTLQMNLGVAIMFPYVDYENAVPIDQQSQCFRIQNYPRAHLSSNPAMAGKQVRFHAERNVRQTLGLMGAT